MDPLFISDKGAFPTSVAPTGCSAAGETTPGYDIGRKK